MKMNQYTFKDIPTSQFICKSRQYILLTHPYFYSSNWLFNDSINKILLSNLFPFTLKQKPLLLIKG